MVQTEKVIWDTLVGFLGNPYGAAGLMGNLYAESALRPTNLQNTYEKKLGMTDAEYTAAVDSGAYKNFVKDSAGYGLAQWTYHTRKAALLSYAREKGTSIGDLTMQLEFLCRELEGYKAVLSALKSAKSVRAASDAVLTRYERPANQGSAVRKQHAAYAQKYFDRYAGKPSAPMRKDTEKVPFRVRVSIPDLNIRKGPGLEYAKTGRFTGVGVFTIVEVSGGWGRLKSGVGWISLNFCSKLS